MRKLLDTIAASTPLTVLTIATIVALATAVAVQAFLLTIVGALALYFVLWWTFLFAVLPIDTAPETDPGRIVPGQDLGAPAAPRLRFKAVLASLVATVAFFLALIVFPLARL